MRWLVLVLLANTAWACPQPDPPVRGAEVLRPAGGPVGRQPWIHLTGVTAQVAIARMAADCVADAEGYCRWSVWLGYEGTEWIRTLSPTIYGERVQVWHQGKLADFVVAEKALPLPLWSGVELTAVTDTQCDALIELAIKPTKASLDGSALLIYFERPVPDHPALKLQTVADLGRVERVVKVRTKTVPKHLWVALSNGELVGPPIQLR